MSCIAILEWPYLLPLFSMKLILLVSLQCWLCIGANAWRKRDLNWYPNRLGLIHAERLRFWMHHNTRLDVGNRKIQTFTVSKFLHCYIYLKPPNYWKHEGLTCWCGLLCLWCGSVVTSLNKSLKPWLFGTWRLGGAARCCHLLYCVEWRTTRTSASNPESYYQCILKTGKETRHL